MIARIVRRWTDEEIETVRSMHTAGKPRYVIANKAGGSLRSVQKKHQRAKGGSSRFRRRQNRRDVASMPLINRIWTNEEIETVLAMREAGKPLYLIANKVGRTKQAVQHIFRDKQKASGAEEDT